MHLLADNQALRGWQAGLAGAPIHFIPTMGALHAGHRALIERARQEAGSEGRVLVSIYVNPTQFNDAKDFQNYPQPLEADLVLCKAAGADAVYAPRYLDLYPDGYRYRVSENAESRHLEGEFRPGHFDGMLTVVLKLLLVVRANQAYFGEKDWQQLRLVQGMVEAFFLPTRIVPCPTVREPDGLAMSSRNVRLSATARAQAATFPRLLRESSSPEAARVALEAAGFHVEYVADHDGRRLGAVVLEGVRLIDNLSLRELNAAANARQLV